MKKGHKNVYLIVGAFLLGRVGQAVAQAAPDSASAPTAPGLSVTASPAAPSPAPTVASANATAQLKTPVAAANDILALIATTRADTDYVGANIHPALITDFSALEAAANAIIKDDGTDATASAGWVNAFVAAINQTIARANSIRNRATETLTAKDKSQQLQKKLSAIRISFHPDAPKASAPAAGSSAAAASGATSADPANSTIVMPGPIPADKTTPAQSAQSKGAATSTPPTTTQRLTTAQNDLKKALASLTKSVPANHGGFIEKARTDATQTSTDIAAALEYLKAHPEMDPPIPGIPPTDKEKFSATTIPSYEIGANGKGKSPNMDAAVESLNGALREFLDDSPSDAPRLLVPELDGSRDKIMGDICQANADVLAAFEFANNRKATPSTSPASGTPAKAP